MDYACFFSSNLFYNNFYLGKRDLLVNFTCTEKFTYFLLFLDYGKDGEAEVASAIFFSFFKLLIPRNILLKIHIRDLASLCCIFTNSAEAQNLLEMSSHLDLIK